MSQLVGLRTGPSVTDVAVNFALPRRRGMIGLEIRNLFDQSFSYQETDLLTTTFARDRLFLARASLSLN